MTHLRIYEREHGLHRRLYLSEGFDPPHYEPNSLAFVDLDGDENVVHTLSDLTAAFAGSQYGQTFHRPIEAANKSAVRIDFQPSRTPLPSPVYAKLTTIASGGPTTPPAADWTRRTLNTLEDLYPSGKPDEGSGQEYYYWDSDVGAWCSLLSGAELAALSFVQSSGTRPVCLVQGRLVVLGDPRLEVAKRALAELVDASRPRLPNSTAHCTVGNTPDLTAADVDAMPRAAVMTGDVHLHGGNVLQQQVGEVPHLNDPLPELWESAQERDVALESLHAAAQPTPTVPSPMGNFSPAHVVPADTAASFGLAHASSPPAATAAVAGVPEGSPLYQRLSSADLTALLGRPPFPKWAQPFIEVQIPPASGAPLAQSDIVFFVPNQMGFARALVEAGSHILADASASAAVVTDAILLLSAATYCDITSAPAAYNLACAFSRRHVLIARSGMSDVELERLERGRPMLWPERAGSSLALDYFRMSSSDFERATVCLSQAIARGFEDETAARMDTDLSALHGTAAFEELMKRLRQIADEKSTAALQHVDSSNGACALDSGRARDLALEVDHQIVGSQDAAVHSPRDDCYGECPSPLSDGDMRALPDVPTDIPADTPAVESTPSEPAAPSPGDAEAAAAAFRRVEHELLLLATTAIGDSRTAIRARVEGLRAAWTDYRSTHGGTNATATRAAAQTAADYAAVQGAAAGRDIAKEAARARAAAAAGATHLQEQWREYESTSATHAEAVQRAACDAARAVQAMVGKELQKVDESLRRDVEVVRRSALDAASITQRAFEQIRQGWATWVEEAARAAPSDDITGTAAGAATATKARAVSAARRFAERVAAALEAWRRGGEGAAEASAAAEAAAEAATAALDADDGAASEPAQGGAPDAHRQPSDEDVDGNLSRASSSDISVLFGTN